MTLFLTLLYFGLIEFKWAANPPADAVTGYKLKLGAGDGTYSLVVDVGNTLSKQLPDDTQFRAAVVTAYNAQGIESEPSVPKIYRPQRPGSPNAGVVPAN